MLKDYYYSSVVDGISSIESHTIDAIDHILLRQACFSSYGRCRGYMKRTQSCGKVFLWKGLYYEVSDECKNFILSLLKLNSAPCSIDYDRLSLLMCCIKPCMDDIPKDLFKE